MKPSKKMTLSSRTKPESTPAPSKTKVFLVDDHPLVREWLTQLIQRENDLAVCGEAEDAPEALQKIIETKPDIVIADISLKTTHGLELVKDLQVRFPALPVLVLSMHDESLYAERVLRAGAKGYITKQEATKKILLAVRQVLSGQIYISEKMASRMVHKMVLGKAQEQKSPIERLTDRELEVFQLIGCGQGTRRIAADLHLGIKTVESYRARIKEKLNLDDGTQLLQQAIQWVHSLKDR
jgi:DNA-binding NarL/FixJ family response regulator